MGGERRKQGVGIGLPFHFPLSTFPFPLYFLMSSAVQRATKSENTL